MIRIGTDVQSKTPSSTLTRKIGTAANPLAIGHGLRLSIYTGRFFIQDTGSRDIYQLNQDDLESTVKIITSVAEKKSPVTAVIIDFITLGSQALKLTPDTAKALLWGLDILKNGPVEQIPFEKLQECPSASPNVNTP